MQIQPLLNQIHKFRTYLDQVKESEAVLHIRVCETPAHIAYFAMFEVRKQVEAILSGWGDELKTAALAEYDRTKEKKLFGVVNVSGKMVVKTYDHTRAIEWVRANAPVLLTVDWAAFEEMALKGRVPWVELEEVARVTKVAVDFSEVALVEVPNE